MELTLKRGSGRSFNGSNWNLVSDAKWETHSLYVANGREKYLGNRPIDGIEHAVFQCLDDTFFAQPINVCELPAPEDPLEVLYSLEMEEEKPRSVPSQMNTGTRVLTFSGKNWKLAAESKWKSSASFADYEESSKVGEKTIGQTAFDVYRTPSGFVAIKQSA